MYSILYVRTGRPRVFVCKRAVLKNEEPPAPWNRGEKTENAIGFLFAPSGQICCWVSTLLALWLLITTAWQQSQRWMNDADVQECFSYSLHMVSLRRVCYEKQMHAGSIGTSKVINISTSSNNGSIVRHLLLLHNFTTTNN